MRLIHLIFAPALLIGACLILGSGCDGNGGAGPTINVKPRNPWPPDHAEHIPVTMTFSWSDLNRTDSTVYDIFFGPSTPPQFKAGDITDTFYNPGTLLADTTYYWRVVAHTPSGDLVESPIWVFETQEDIRFPIVAGNKWFYQSKTYVLGIHPPELEGQFGFTDTLYASSITEVLSDTTLLDTIPVFRFHTSWYEEGESGYYDRYVNNTDSGLYLYAYHNVGTFPPKVKPESGVCFEFNGVRAASVTGLFQTILRSAAKASALSPSFVIEDPPVRELAYPLEDERPWLYRSIDLGHPITIGKEIVGKDRVRVPAGDFRCYTIQWFWDIDGDSDWDADINGYDYISSVGIVRRAFYIYGINIIDYGGQILGTFDSAIEYDLLAFFLQ